MAMVKLTSVNAQGIEEMRTSELVVGGSMKLGEMIGPQGSLLACGRYRSFMVYL